jgi:hypothetical protein
VISACLITKDATDSLLRAIASIRPMVDQVVVVRTSLALWTADELRRLAPSVTGYCPESLFAANCECCGSKAGDIRDFALARNLSFELAGGDRLVWLDSDDVVHGPRHLTITHDRVGGPRVLYPYDYSLRSRFYVPRVVPRTERWKYPVHEMLDGGTVGLISNDFVWKHERTHEAACESSRRNHRLLTHHFNQTPDVYKHDARMWYFLGRSCLDIGQPIQALPKLERAFTLETWDEQRASIAMELARGLPVHLHDMKLDWAWKAARAKPDWRSVWRTLASLHSGALRDQFTEMALTLPPQETILSIDPTEWP